MNNNPSFSATGPFEIPGLNTAKGLYQAANNLPVYRRVLQKFATNHRNDLDAVKAALAENNNEEAKRLIHTLKGASAAIAAEELYCCAAEIETGLLNENDPVVLAEQLNLANKALETVVSGIVLYCV